MSKQETYYLYGAGGHSMVIAELLEVSGMQITGFYDEMTYKNEVFGYPVLKSAKELNTHNDVRWIICVGNNKARKAITEKQAFLYGRAIHPTAQISKRSSIGEGTVIMAGVVVNSSAAIGKHVILNTNASIDHECILEDYVHVSPGASLAGNVVVGEGTHIGTGASVIPGVKIGKWCTIGAGAAIIKDVPDFATVVGVPGRVIKLGSAL